MEVKKAIEEVFDGFQPRTKQTLHISNLSTARKENKIFLFIGDAFHRPLASSPVASDPPVAPFFDFDS